MRDRLKDYATVCESDSAEASDLEWADFAGDDRA